MDVRHAARVLGISVAGARRLVSDGRLRSDEDLAALYERLGDLAPSLGRYVTDCLTGSPETGCRLIKINS